MLYLVSEPKWCDADEKWCQRCFNTTAAEASEKTVSSNGMTEGHFNNISHFHSWADVLRDKIMAVISLWLNMLIAKALNALVCVLVCVCALVNLNALVYVYVASQWTWQMCRPFSVCYTKLLPSDANRKHTHTHTHTHTHIHTLPPLRPRSPPHLHNNNTTPPLSSLPERPCPNQTQQINNSACRSCHGINYAQRVSFIRGLSAGCPWHVSGCPCISAAQR